MDDERDKKRNELVAMIGFFLIVETILIGTILFLLFGH